MNDCHKELVHYHQDRCNHIQAFFYGSLSGWSILRNPSRKYLWGFCSRNKFRNKKALLRKSTTGHGIIRKNYFLGGVGVTLFAVTVIPSFLITNAMMSSAGSLYNTSPELVSSTYL